MPRLRDVIRKHCIFPKKGVTSVPLSASLQKKLDGMMVATTHKPKVQGNAGAIAGGGAGADGPRVACAAGFHCQLAGANQKLGWRDVAPDGDPIHEKQRRLRNCKRPTFCPSSMSLSAVNISQAALKEDPRLARMNDPPPPPAPAPLGGWTPGTGPPPQPPRKRLHLVLSRLHNHTCTDPDLRRCIPQAALDFLHGLFEAGNDDINGVKTKLDRQWNEVGKDEAGKVGVGPSINQLLQIQATFLLSRWGPAAMTDCTGHARRHFDRCASVG